MMAVIHQRLVGALMLLAMSIGSATAGEKLLLTNGPSSAPGHAAGVALSTLTKIELLPEKNIDLNTLSSKGVIDDVRRLRAGDADLAILPSAIGHAARLGSGSFAGEPPATGFRAIASLWQDALHVIMRASDVETGTIEDLSRLKDRSVFLGEASTGSIDINRLLLADLGMEADRRFELVAIDDGDGIAAIKRGQIDLFSATAAVPAPMFNGIFEGQMPNLRFLDVNETQITKANSNHWLWTRHTIPAGTYPGQSRQIRTIALSNLLVVRADVDPSVVYALTRSVFENLAYIKRIAPNLAGLSLESALAGMALPLHPGALSYYREKGVIPISSPEKSPSVVPVRQGDGYPRELPEDRYPNDNVAGSPAINQSRAKL